MRCLQTSPQCIFGVQPAVSTVAHIVVDNKWVPSASTSALAYTMDSNKDSSYANAPVYEYIVVVNTTAPNGYYCNVSTTIFLKHCK